MSQLAYFNPFPSEEKTIQADLCIYGGVSGGVVAAVEAARRGLAVVLLESSAHLGGMTSGGLSFTDLGRKEYGRAIGGLALDFYRRAGSYYGNSLEWYFEPHAAEAIFEEWLSASEVKVFRNQFVAGVAREGSRITSIRTVSGLSVKAAMFIDASYEGDLMARAGVSYRVGRDANALHAETFNGMQVRDNRFDYLVDPWKVPSTPSSGLLPGIEDGSDYAPGRGDGRIQAYNFRLCLTREAGLKIPFPKPAGYRKEDYELFRRYLQAGWRDVFGKFDPIRGNKADMNNHGAVSTDYIGMNHSYPEADYGQRETIFQDHVRHQQGMMWWLSNEPEVPVEIRDRMREWGLCADEFTGTGGWSRQLYVRESRRMAAELVMTEHHCLGAEIVEDSVGLAAHGMDSHTCRRIVLGQTLFNEGDVQVHPLRPYPVSYRSIVPKRPECSNLLVTFCLGASHMAFGSIRMEPVLMVLSQSAAIAAAMAIEQGSPVQEVDYAGLRGELEKAGQVLEWERAFVI